MIRLCWPTIILFTWCLAGWLCSVQAVPGATFNEEETIRVPACQLHGGFQISVRRNSNTPGQLDAHVVGDTLATIDTGASVRVQARWKYFPFSVNFNICDEVAKQGTPCPLKAGRHEFTLSVRVPYVPADLSVQLKAVGVDQHGCEIFNVEDKVTIRGTPARQQEPAPVDHTQPASDQDVQSPKPPPYWWMPNPLRQLPHAVHLPARTPQQAALAYRMHQHRQRNPPFRLFRP